MDREFSKELPGIVADYCNRNRKELKEIEDVLNPNLSDEEFEKKLEKISWNHIKNSHFWYYVHDFVFITSTGKERKITIQTFDEDNNYEHGPVKYVRFWESHY